MVYKYYELISDSTRLAVKLEYMLDQKMASDSIPVRRSRRSRISALFRETKGDVPDGYSSESIVNKPQEPDFEVLYKNSVLISPRREIKTWYGRVKEIIPSKISIELLVKSENMPCKPFESILYSIFDVQKKRDVTRASLKFSTVPSHPEGTEKYNDLIKEYANKVYLNVDVNSRTQDEVTWGNHSGAYILGYAVGNIEEILEFREWLTKNGVGINIKSNQLQFIK